MQCATQQANLKRIGLHKSKIVLIQLFKQLNHNITQLENQKVNVNFVLHTHLST